MNLIYVHVLIGAYNKVTPLSLGTQYPDKKSELTGLSRKRYCETEYLFCFCFFTTDMGIFHVWSTPHAAEHRAL